MSEPWIRDDSWEVRDEDWEEIGDPAEEEALRRLEQAKQEGRNMAPTNGISAEELNSTIVGLRDGYVKLGRSQFATDIHKRIKLWAQEPTGSVENLTCVSLLQDLLDLCKQEFAELHQLIQRELKP